jgi:hypothetical protein
MSKNFAIDIPEIRSRASLAQRQKLAISGLLDTPTDGESKTVNLVPNPYDLTANGGQFVWAQILNATEVIFRAPLAAGGYNCYLTFAGLVTSVGHRVTNPDGSPGGLSPELILYNAAGGALQSFNFPMVLVNCGDVNKAFTLSQAISPDLFDLTTAMAFTFWEAPGQTWPCTF